MTSFLCITCVCVILFHLKKRGKCEADDADTDGDDDDAGDGDGDGDADGDDDDKCMICHDSLDTTSIWGRFVCSTCPHWYHYDCLAIYKSKEDSYHRDSRTRRYDMTRLKCIICRQSPRTIETL